MRFEHGSHRTECLAALIVLLLLCCCCSAADVPPPFGTFRQCLHLDEDVGPWEACGAQGRSVRLRFCDAYEPARLVRACNAGALARLREKDGMAREAACRFRKLLDRYDCENANSVSWTCKDCEVSILLNPLLPNPLCDHSKVPPSRVCCHLSVNNTKRKSTMLVYCNSPNQPQSPSEPLCDHRNDLRDITCL
ncbi:uncharacterized protein TNIN_146551 [Trichonephila inaurata madagascariensis]|uniref:Uncharacterized protein n=1 Tax=Trichonephila inaurata madagascariensis TaxID=2747483 RepID=A0A8X6WU82_9ARAC|nr:uncharacterized protein TNIN_146551 [Trichonephila inaurata madagascariensis]